jgi:hypothetical protein
VTVVAPSTTSTITLRKRCHSMFTIREIVGEAIRASSYHRSVVAETSDGLSHIADTSACVDWAVRANGTWADSEKCSQPTVWPGQPGSDGRSACPTFWVMRLL